MFSLDRCSITSRNIYIFWSYLDIIILFYYSFHFHKDKYFLRLLARRPSDGRLVAGWCHGSGPEGTGVGHVPEDGAEPKDGSKLRPQGRSATLGPLTPACARLKGGRRLVTAAVFVGYKRRPPAGGQREAKRSVGRRQEAVAIKRRL